MTILFLNAVGPANGNTPAEIAIPLVIVLAVIVVIVKVMRSRR